ncbi:MAG: hypothetical protein AVDCRST_MAG67-3158, partial [uncultured Solirubrobacteraceae bacterium]
ESGRSLRRVRRPPARVEGLRARARGLAASAVRRRAMRREGAARRAHGRRLEHVRALPHRGLRPPVERLHAAAVRGARRAPRRHEQRGDRRCAGSDRRSGGDRLPAARDHLDPRLGRVRPARAQGGVRAGTDRDAGGDRRDRRGSHRRPAVQGHRGRRSGFGLLDGEAV